MKEAEIILVTLPQANGESKRRPAVVLRSMPTYQDWLVCGVSTQLHQAIQGFDDIMLTTDPDFATSGLRSTSVIRLSFLAVIPTTKIMGSIGSLSPQRHRQLLKTLSDYLHSE